MSLHAQLITMSKYQWTFKLPDGVDIEEMNLARPVVIIYGNPDGLSKAMQSFQSAINSGLKPIPAKDQFGYDLSVFFIDKDDNVIGLK